MNIVALAVIKLALIALLGFFLYKKKIIQEESLKFLTFFVINISMPCLIFSHIIEGVKDISFINAGLFILLSVVIFCAGSALGFIFSCKSAGDYRREFIISVAFQNGGYLPMSIAFFLFPPGIREKFLVYVFIYLLGFNILMWSIGSFFIFKRNGQRFKLVSIFNPPVAGAIIALAAGYADLSRFIPDFVMSPVKMTGETSFVFSMIILGCWLGKVKIEDLGKTLVCAGRLSFVKLIVMPLIFLAFIVKFEVFSLFGLFILLQAAMPSAASLPIIVSLRGGSSEFVSQGVFLTHIMSIFTIPLWLGIFLKISGFSF